MRIRRTHGRAVSGRLVLPGSWSSATLPVPSTTLRSSRSVRLCSRASLGSLLLTVAYCRDGQAEAVSRELGVPVLVHRAKKPSRRCALDVARYFSPRPEKSSYPPVPVVSSSTLRGARVAWNEGERTRLLAIGDRLTTDIILASRIRDLLDSPGPFWRRLWTSASSSGKGKAKATEEDAEGQDRVVSVLTDRLLAKERAGTRLMRWMEERMLRYGYWVEAKRLQRRRRLDTSTTGTDAPRTPTATTNAWRDCLLEQPALPPAPPAPSSSSLPAASPTSLPLASSLASLPSYLLSSLRTTATRLGRAGIHRLGGAGVELGKRVSKWYEGGYGLGVREPDGWRRLAAWKRMRIGRD